MFLKKYFLLKPLLIIYFFAVTHVDAMDIQLAKTYESEKIDLTYYWYSEKYDGVRAYWDGKNLYTRNNIKINLPASLKRTLPNTYLDGELWAGRGQFELISGLSRKKQSQIQDWNTVRYMVFDLPKHKGIFKERYHALQALHAGLSPIGFWEVVQQFAIESKSELYNKLDDIASLGGEGLMLKNINSLYSSGRSNDLLKLKRYQDAEAHVIGYKPGKGKYLGKVGSLHVKTKSGLTFYIGSGLSDAMRANPPPIGTIITYKYYGKTDNGKPRFASFMRIKVQHNNML